MEKEYNIYENRIYKIIQSNSCILRDDPNIIGMGIGNKIINGVFTDIPTLTIFVKRKLTGSNLNYTRKIPKYIYGVLTDIIESGEFKYTSQKVKPALGGVSIGNEKIYKYGTLAYAVTEKGTRLGIYALGCNHVMTQYNPGRKGEIIIQPGNVPGDLVDYYELARYSKGITLKLGIPKDQKNYNEVDAAIAYVGPNNETTKRTLLSLGLLDKITITKITKVKSKDEVMKIGAETKMTVGQVLTASTSIRMKIDGEETAFKNQITTNMLTEEGDSGALGIAKKDSGAFGILMGKGEVGGTKVACFNPLDRVLDLLGVELLIER